MTPRSLVARVLCIASLAACERSTSDKNLVLVRPDETLTLASRDAGVFGKHLKVVIVDPRTEALYEAGHVRGAISMPMPTMNDAAVPTLGAEGNLAVLVYGANANDVLGPAASKRLIELGYDHVYTLRGGLDAWVKAQMPTVTGKDPG